MSDADDMFYCSFVSIHYIICECGETFPTEDQLKIHLERDHAHKKEKKEYACGVCQSVFGTEQACIEHYENTHIEIKQEHDYVEQEHDYVEQEQDYVEQEQDYVEQEQDYVEQEQDYVEQEQDYVEQEHAYVDMETEPIEDYGETSDMIYENVKVEPDISQEINVFAGNPPAMRSKSGARRNTGGERVRVKRERKPKSFYNIKNIVCEVCGKRYASNAALKYHQRVHTGERPYKCTECPKSFTMPLFLQIHIRTHTGERPYECKLCPKAFSNKAALLRHDRVHTGVKPYGCPECGKYFTQSNSMKLHVNTVHLKMPTPYKSKSRKNKAKEREMMREAILRVMDDEEVSAVKSISQPKNPSEMGLHYVKEEVEEEVKVEVEESEIVYDDEDSREITYEVVYED